LEEAHHARLPDENIRKSGGTGIKDGWIAQNKTQNLDLEPELEVHKWLHNSINEFFGRGMNMIIIQ
jgi:hypothetical protein